MSPKLYREEEIAMSENLEDVIRKSLDSVERRRKKLLWLGVILAIVAVWFLFTMAMFVDKRPQDLNSLALQVMLGFDGLAAVIAAMSVFIGMTLQRNTRAILKAI